ncbi:hypothetical protein HAX54_022948 [Datura stramonium]|uniref:Uncharacterized protein n=1 Tax=Datura stramonium TaxID=4076 RepID=A0ABS8UVE9_DATST|nr:hypothetical protein [Datura stramonium]
MGNPYGKFVREVQRLGPLLVTVWIRISNARTRYPAIMIRYEIQTGAQDPYDDCVATMRLYMRMKSQGHKREEYPLLPPTHKIVIILRHGGETESRDDAFNLLILGLITTACVWIPTTFILGAN